MGNAKTNLEYLKTTKSLIKQAIIDKGVEVSDTDTFRSYKDKIKNIITAVGEDPSSELKNITFGLDTSVSNGTDLKGITTNITSSNLPTLVDITQVGAPSININGIASGFSSSNYYTMNAFDNIDIYLLVNLSNTSSGANICFDSSGVYWFGNYNNHLGGYLNGSYTSSFEITTGINYWVCYSLIGTTLNIYALADNGYTKDTVPRITDEAWTHVLTDRTISKNETHGLGVNFGSSSEYWHGTIDFLNSFGEYNGETVWTPARIEED